MIKARRSTQNQRSNQRHTHNEAKFKILYFLFKNGRHYAPEEIAEQVKMTPASVRTRLSKMWFQGYIYRKKEYRIHRKNPYCYGFLKQMGNRVLLGTNRYTGLIKRMEMREVIGENISLNLREEPTMEQFNRYERLIMHA